MTSTRRGTRLARAATLSSILSSARSVAWPMRVFRLGFHSRPVSSRLTGVRRAAEAIIQETA